MQTLAQSGSTKTGPFHDLHQRLVHEVGPPHYEEKAAIAASTAVPPAASTSAPTCAA